MGRDVRIDLTQLTEFKDKLQALSKEIDEIHMSLAKSIARTFLSKVIKKTPWQTKTLVRGWKTEVKKEGLSYKIEVSNSVQYAYYVEYGHRTSNNKGWVSGRFMLTETELEVEKNLEVIIRKKLNEIIKKRLGI